MTQKEKLIKASLLARRVKSIASQLEYDANDYDVNFPHQYVRQLRECANNFLELK